MTHPIIVLGAGGFIWQQLVRTLAQHGEQVFLHALDHLAVDESNGGGVVDLEFDAARVLNDAQLEVLVFVEQLGGIVAVAARVEDRERAAPQQRVQLALAAVEQLGDLLMGEVFEAAAGCHAGGDEFVGIHDRGGGG